MLELSRTVRICLNPGDAALAITASGRARNSFAAWPSMIGLGAFCELEVRCRGSADPVTGYLMNISRLDDAVRRTSIQLLAQAMWQSERTYPPAVLRGIVRGLQQELHDALSSVRWRLTPHYHLTMHAKELDRVIMSQQFEFAASHRLHCDSMTPEQNRSIFGKCNNPSGHGHNYRLQVNVSTPVDGRGREMGLQTLEGIVDRVIIQRFDHKHLNLDTVEFAKVNPSVENIARVCYELLKSEIDRTSDANLVNVTVWETEKTSCTYPA